MDELKSPFIVPYDERIAELNALLFLRNENIRLKEHIRTLEEENRYLKYKVKRGGLYGILN